jgi:predicted transcriptional regulator
MMAARKEQLTIYLEPGTLRALEALAKKRGSPKSLVAEAAVVSFLTGDDADRREAAITKRMDHILRILARLERNDAVDLEAHAEFVRLWLMATPALPEHARPAARAKGNARFEDYIVAVGRRLAEGGSMLREVALDIVNMGPADATGDS